MRIYIKILFLPMEKDAKKHPYLLWGEGVLSIGTSGKGFA